MPSSNLLTMRHHLSPSHAAVISGASGAPAATREEADFLHGLGLPVRALGDGASAIPWNRRFLPTWRLPRWRCRTDRLFAPLEASEQPMDGELRQVLVTSGATGAARPWPWSKQHRSWRWDEPTSTHAAGPLSW